MSCIFVDQNGLYSIGELQDSVQYLGDGESHFPGGNGAHNIDAAHINDLLHVAPEVHVMGRVSSTCDSFSFGMLAVALCVAPTSLRDFIEKMHAEHLEECPEESTIDEEVSRLSISKNSRMLSDTVSVNFLGQGWRPPISPILKQQDCNLHLSDLTETILDLITGCWNQDPTKRPACSKILRVAHVLVEKFKRNSNQDPEDDEPRPFKPGFEN